MKYGTQAAYLEETLWRFGMGPKYVNFVDLDGHQVMEDGVPEDTIDAGCETEEQATEISEWLGALNIENSVHPNNVEHTWVVSLPVDAMNLSRLNGIAKEWAVAELLSAAADAIAGAPPVPDGYRGMISDELWAAICERFKIRSKPKALGNGAFGTAYDIGGNRVLKISTDSVEAASAARIANKHTNHLARVFDIVKVRSSDPYADENDQDNPFNFYYLTLLEKLEPLNDKGLEEALDAVHQGRLAVRDLLQSPGNKLREARQFVQEATDEAKKYGITPADSHGGNVMKRKDGSLVLFDMGGQSYHTGPSPDIHKMGSPQQPHAAVIDDGDGEADSSDEYLTHDVMPSISDDQFAAVVGIHGFVLKNALALDPHTQKVEGLLKHQEADVGVQFTIQGSYIREDDGEWALVVQNIDNSGKISDHQPFEWDPETDAVNIMKSLVRILSHFVLKGGSKEQEPNPEEVKDSHITQQQEK